MLHGMNGDTDTRSARWAALGSVGGSGVGANAWLVICAWLGGSPFAALLVTVAAAAIMFVHFRLSVRRPQAALLHGLVAIAAYLAVQLPVVLFCWDAWSKKPAFARNAVWPNGATVTTSEMVFSMAGVYAAVAALFAMLYLFRPRPPAQ